MAQQSKESFPLPPGSTIGIMGGGQLGRMTALSAANFGYRCHIFTPEIDSPAEQVSAAATVASYTDRHALEAFADAVDVITFEFENVPFKSVQILAERVPVKPGWECLRISQDRLVEKTFINDLGIPTTPFATVSSVEELQSAAKNIGTPGILKTARLGYDGKGQVNIAPDTDLGSAWKTIAGSAGGDIAIYEAFVDLAMEVSVIVARSSDGTWATFPPVDNRHKNHILDETHAIANIPDRLGQAATSAAIRIAENMGLIGLLAVEMFITHDPNTSGVGSGSRVLINEIAPRPHNSGHWTMDACVSSQFEQFIRAVAGLPLGSTERHHDAVMKNLIGDDVDNWRDVVGSPNQVLHLYGKAEARPGRKMGHVNRLYPLGHLAKS